MQLSLLWKIVIAICASIFGLAIALTTQYIKLQKLPKFLIFVSLICHIILSWGVFLFVMIFFNSGFLPSMIPNDEWSALTIAYFCSSIPHITTTTLLLIYAKEVNNWLNKRYPDTKDALDINNKDALDINNKDAK